MQAAPCLPDSEGLQALRTNFGLPITTQIADAQIFRHDQDDAGFAREGGLVRIGLGPGGEGRSQSRQQEQPAAPPKT